MTSREAANGAGRPVSVRGAWGPCPPQPREKALYARLREKAEREYQIPFSTRTHVAAGTIRDWLKGYRKAGFEGLKPKVRADLGESRAIPRRFRHLLLSFKEEHPEATVQQVIAWVQQSGKAPRGGQAQANHDAPPALTARADGARGAGGEQGPAALLLREGR